MSQRELKKHQVKPPFEAIRELLGEIPLKIPEDDNFPVHLVLWDADRNCYHSYLSDPANKSIQNRQIEELVERLRNFVAGCQKNDSEELEEYLEEWVDRNSQEADTKQIVRSWLGEAKKTVEPGSDVDTVLSGDQEKRVEAVQLLLSSIPMYRDFDVAGRFDRLFRNGQHREDDDLKWFAAVYDDENRKINIYREECERPDSQGYVEYLKGETELPGESFAMGIKENGKGKFFENYEALYEHLQELLYSNEFDFKKSIYFPLYIEGIFYGLVYAPVGDLEDRWNDSKRRENLWKAANNLRKEIDRHLIPLIQSLYEIEFQRRMTDAIGKCMSYEEFLDAYCRNVNFLGRCTSCSLNDHNSKRKISVWEQEEPVPLFYSFEGSEKDNGSDEDLHEISFKFERKVPDAGTSKIFARTPRVVPDYRQSDREFFKQKNKIRLQQHFRLAQEQFDARMRMLRSGRRAAVAAIMSRNMSHNIGSHVLAKLSSGDDFKDLDLDPDWKSPVSEFNEFLRTRMDFIADVVTSAPAASIPVEIYQDAIAPFAPSQNSRSEGQKLLINHISGVKSLGLDSITITVVDADGNKIDENAEEDLPFSSPNGLLGAQSIYVIVENIIRNSAKHAYDKSSDDDLEITICIQEEVKGDPDLLEVNVFDNLDNGSKGLTDKLNGLVTDSIIDKNGGLEYEGWGVREMKICAAYLRGVAPERLDDSHSPTLLSADEFDGNLGYRFYLRRPKEAVILDTDARLEPDLPEAEEAEEEEYDLETWRGKLRRAGIEHTTDEKILEEAVDYHFLIAVDPNEEVVDILEDSNFEDSNSSNSLPLRILVASSDSDTSSRDFEGFPVVSLEEINGLKRNFEADQFLLKVRKMWHCERHNGECLSLRLDTRATDEDTVSIWEDTNRVEVYEEKVSEELRGSVEGTVVFDRHGRLTVDENFCNDSDTPYEPYDQGTSIYQLLKGAPQNDLRREKLTLEMIEAGATGVAVLDERVQALLEGKTECFRGGEVEKPVREILKWSGVWVPNKTENDLDYPSQIDREFFDEVVINKVHSRSKNNGKKFLVVHLGVLEKLYRGKDQIEKIRSQVAEWEQNGAEVVIISGRGSPPMAQKVGTRFLHYSQVAKYLTKERSKYHLCKALFSSRSLPS